jgi:hypothetical protein
MSNTSIRPLMNSDLPQIGDEIDMKKVKRNVSRRDLLRTIGVFGFSSVGIKKAIQSAYGEELDGTPITHTVDIYGEPDKVRLIPKERYRRLQVYKDLDVEQLINRHDVLNSIRIVQRSDDEEDLALEFLLDEKDGTITNDLPSELNNIPVEYTEMPIETELEDCGGCSARFNRRTLRGGVAIGFPGKGTCNDWAGTLGLVCYDRDTNDPLAITCQHVMEGETTMHQGPPGSDRSEPIASLRSQSRDTDIASYRIHTGVSHNPKSVVRNDVPDTTGVWTFAGLSDVVSSDGESPGSRGEVPVQHSGSATCRSANACNHTKRSDNVDFQADLEIHSTTGGDSGSPWVDNDGKLLAIHVGRDSFFGNSWSFGTVGRPALNSVGGKLHR